MLTNKKSQLKSKNTQENDYIIAKKELEQSKRSYLIRKSKFKITKSTFHNYLWIGVSVLILFLSYLVTLIEGFSRGTMLFLGSAVAAMIFWILNIIPDVVVGLMLVMFWVMSGLASPDQALSGFSTLTWLYMFCILALGVAISRSGILFRLSLYSLKIFPKSYRGQLVGLAINGIAVNPLIPSSSAMVALAAPISKNISDSMGFKKLSNGSAGLSLTAMVFYGFLVPFFLTGSYSNTLCSRSCL